MAWYYVKSGGTATGDGGRVTTQRTGAWSGTASEYYDNVADADDATTKPTDGDFVLCSDLHAFSGASTDFSVNSTGASAGAGLYVISVDDANQENYKPGASETMTGAQLRLSNNSLFAGVSFTLTSAAVDFMFYSSTTTRKIEVRDCLIKTIPVEGIAVYMGFADGPYFRMVNVDIDGDDSIFNAFGGARIEWLGGTLVATNNVSLTAPAAHTFGAGGGATVYFEGVDLSVHSGTVLGAAFSATTTDATTVEFVNCRLHASLTLPADSDLVLPQHRFIMRACDDSTGGDLFRFHYQTGCGKAVNNESVFVTGEKPWGETADNSSVEVTTTSICSHGLPFVFDFPLAQQYIDLADAASNVLRLPITTTLTLTDTEIAAFLMYPDGTTSVQPNWITSGKTVGTGNYGVDPMDAGATLPTSTTTWTAAKTNKYHLELDTSGDAGQVQAVGVRIEVYRASIVANTLMLATEFEVS